MKASRIAAIIGFVCTLALILYFTFRESSRVSEISWMPQRWGLWLDSHDEFRHFIGFAFFAGIGFAINLDPILTRSRRRFIRRLRSSRHRTGRLGGMMVLVYILELGQLAMPGRDFDWLDVVNGWGGIIFAWSIWYATKSRERRRRRLANEKRHMPINISSVHFR